jgi:hypothetical protein
MFSLSKKRKHETQFHKNKNLNYFLQFFFPVSWAIAGGQCYTLPHIAARQCVAVCGSARGSVWHAVCTVMCARVRTAVCASALGSVWQCTRQCAAGWQCGSARQCECAAVWQCAAVCGSVRKCVAVRMVVCTQCAR